MHPLLWLFFGGIILTIGDVVFKFFVESHRTSLYVFGLLLYLFGTVFLVESYKSENIAVATTIFVLVNIITLTIVSWFYFDEKLTNVQLFAILLAGISVVLLELGA